MPARYGQGLWRLIPPEGPWTSKKAAATGGKQELYVLLATAALRFLMRGDGMGA